LGWSRTFPPQALLSAFVAPVLPWVYLSPFTPGLFFYRDFELRGLTPDAEGVDLTEREVFLGLLAPLTPFSAVGSVRDLSQRSPEDLTYLAPLKRLILASFTEFAVFKRFFVHPLRAAPLPAVSFFFLSLLSYSLWHLMAVPKHKRFKISPPPSGSNFFTPTKRVIYQGFYAFEQPLRLSPRVEPAPTPSVLGPGCLALTGSSSFRQPLGFVRSGGPQNTNPSNLFHCLGPLTLGLEAALNTRGYLFPLVPLFFLPPHVYLGFWKNWAGLYKFFTPRPTMPQENSLYLRSYPLWRLPFSFFESFGDHLLGRLINYPPRALPPVLFFALLSQTRSPYLWDWFAFEKTRWPHTSPLLRRHL
jgi:hypothetical protein